MRGGRHAQIENVGDIADAQFPACQGQQDLQTHRIAEQLVQLREWRQQARVLGQFRLDRSDLFLLETAHLAGWADDYVGFRGQLRISFRHFRHEQQVQQLQAELRQAQQTIVVKQEDITRLNQEGARLVSDLTHARKDLHKTQESACRITQRLEALQAVEQRNGELATQLAEMESRAQALRQQLARQTEKAERLAAQMRDLELALAQSQARYESQQGIVAELRAYLDSRQAQAPKE